MNTTPPPFENLAILASAGTGKTYQLTHRIIHLLGMGVPPDRICAMTFSRKAAGEIYSELIAHLGRAARDPERAEQTARGAELTDFSPTDALRLLGRLLREPQKVHIGTLDHFFVSVLRAFSPELGVPPDFKLAESESPEIRRQALQILSDINRVHSAPLIQLFRETSFGRDEASFYRFFERILTIGRPLFHRYPHPAAWGNGRRIWPNNPRWLRQGLAEWRGEAERARGEIAALPLPEKIRAILREFVHTLSEFRPYQSLEIRQKSKVVEALVCHWETLHAGLELEYGRSLVTIPPSLGEAFQRLLSRPLLFEILRVRKQTRGLGRLLDWFEQRYDEAARQGGIFTFDDVQRFLSPRHAADASLSRQPEVPNRLYLDYRLDARLDHWLLDEFQDTSDLQWSVLENLADEIIQDNSGTRSFFLVGDVKQAIYGWRQGNARLMGEIIGRYGYGHPRAFRQKILSESFRSAQPVLDAVNAIFNHIAEETRLPEPARAFWKQYWKPHQSSTPHRPGCACWLEWAGPTTDSSGNPSEEDDNEEKREGIHRAMAAVIRELSPAERNLSVAVLLRTNKECRNTTDALRLLLNDTGIPIANEGASEIADNPAVALLCAVLRYAAHPGDTLALGHLRMSPLKSHFDPPNTSLPAQLLETLQNRGFCRFIAEWENRLHTAIPDGLSAYDAESLTAFKTLALQADQTGTDSVDRFLETVETRQRRDLDDRPGVVRVMTIHQSKGLGFDGVLAPFQSHPLGLASAARGMPLFLTHAQGETGWVLKCPSPPWRRMDPILRATLEEAESRTAFENLCLLYVALTRARSGLYLFSDFGEIAPDKKRPVKEPAFTAVRLAALGLLGHPEPGEVGGERISAGGQPLRRLFLQGDWTWFESFPKKAPPEEKIPTPLSFIAGDREAQTRKRIRLIEPSEEETRAWGVRCLLSPEAEAMRQFGNAIHTLLAKVSWLEESDPARIAENWQPDPSWSKAIRLDATRQFLALFEKPEIRSAFRRPTEPAWLWREKSFEWMESQEWISGIFDRVVVKLDQAGYPREAEILDFKSARIETEAEATRASESYIPQMRLYRRALAGLLGLPQARIAVRLLFTRPALFVTVF